MINGSDFFKIKGNYKKYLNKNFKNKKLHYQIIRIAAHYRDIENILKYIKHLKKIKLQNLFQLDAN